MIIIGRLFATLSFLFFYRFLKDKNLLNNLKTAPNGLQYKQISKRSIAIPIKQKFYFRILKETAWHRFCKKIGLGVEFQTGNLEFDKTYYIEADQKSILNVIQMNDELKQVVIKLAERGVHSIQSTSSGVLKIKTQGESATNLSEVLLELKHLIDGLSDSSTEKDSFFQSAYFLEFILMGLGAYAFISVGSLLAIDAGDTHLHPIGLLIPGLILGLLVVLFWILLASLFLKKSSRAPVLLFESLGTLAITLAISGPQAMLDLNQVLDKSEPEAVLARVDQVEIKKISVRRIGRRTRSARNYYIHLSIPQNKYEIPDRLKVSFWDLSQFVEGRGVAISVRQGFFDSPYIAGFSSRTLYKRKLFQVSDEEMKALENFSPEPFKNWENLPGLTWKEEHYASGKLRQREPMIEGRQHGIASYWHENGVKYADILWLNGQKNGKFTLYREDGSVDQSLSYLEGELHGVSTWYDQKGRVISKGVYQKGKLVKDLLK